MKHSQLGWIVVITAFAVSMGAAPAAAKGGPKAKAPKPTVHAASVKPTATTKAHGSSSMAKTKAQTPKVKATGATKAKGNSSTVKVSGKPGSLKSDSATVKTKGAENKASKPSATTATGPIAPLNKAQRLLMKNDNLRMKVASRLPAGWDPILAAAGFRNLGQFVAAVNVSFNHPEIQFKALRGLMTGTPPMSLGQALQQLRGLDPATATSTANTAFAQANADITATGPTAPTATKKTRTRKS